MANEYKDLDDVKAALKKVFNKCSKNRNNIDSVGLIYNRGVVLTSDQKIDQRIAATLANNFFQTAKNSFGDSSNLKDITCMIEEEGKLIAWTVVHVVDNTALIFSGDLEDDEMNLNLHRSCISGYKDELIELAKKFIEFT
ncbi:hypothetical protein PMG71_05310 [Roseofilum sp. BLCC_M154]|uniref:Roadblock/LAMTOR2 domain-containing protein n=1 Tax=Roseofilum acuticapitatum BLCC-M154 TaxID=3022444 RepID=A0ABT7APK8_9CYAN|nr:hypothetical protein [Roseofilum acuticapitatum]MDJ1168837.1 hypothetical protein [Roseofilum acuticapitatum BLCC-M154]